MSRRNPQPRARPTTPKPSNPISSFQIIRQQQQQQALEQFLIELPIGYSSKQLPLVYLSPSLLVDRILRTKKATFLSIIVCLAIWVLFLAKTAPHVVPPPAFSTATQLRITLQVTTLQYTTQQSSSLSLINKQRLIKQTINNGYYQTRRYQTKMGR